MSQMCTGHLRQAQLAFHCLVIRSDGIASHSGRPVRSLHSAPSSGRQMKHPGAGAPAGRSRRGECGGQKSHLAE
eukprot:7841006-Pyramimonas_sp.AAC.1